MEQLDYDFHLFTEAETCQDSIIYHSGDGYRLAQVNPEPHRLGPVSIPLTAARRPRPSSAHGRRQSGSKVAVCRSSSSPMPARAGETSSTTATTATMASSRPANRRRVA